MKAYDACIRAFVMGNLGDDLFIHTLCNRYPNRKFVLCGEKKYKSLFQSVHNLEYISTDSFWVKWIFRLNKLPAWIGNKLSEKLGSDKYYALPGCFEWLSRHSKENILISGSLFMQIYENKKCSSPFFQSEIGYYNRHPYVIGCNFGPYINEEYREFYERRFYKARQVTFRDRYSDSLFPGDCTNWAPDILFTYDIERKKRPSIEHYVAISVINLNKDGNHDEKKAVNYEEAIVALINYILQQNKKVVLLGLCRDQGDQLVINRIISKLPQTESVYSLCYPETSAEEIVGYLAYADCVVASRFHAMVLAWVYDKVAIPVIYSEKMTNTIQCVNPDIPMITTEEIKEGTKNLVEIYQESLQLGLKPDIEAIRKQAQKHFEKLDRIF